MTRPGRFLFRMAIFLAVVAGVTVVLFPQIERAFMANPGLNGLILGVLLIGVAHSVRRVVMLGGEIGWIESMRRQRRGSLAIPPPPRLLSTVAAAFGESEGRMRLSAMSMRSLLDGISARLGESGEMSRYLIGLSIFLGLLGTFWGLLETVASVGTVIGRLDVGGADTAAVFQDLKAGLEAPLSGMGTAFSSSLFGLSGALVLGFLDLQAGQAQNRFFNELEEWLSSVTRHGASGIAIEGDAPVPVYIQALLEQTAESLEELRRIIGRSEEGRWAAQQSMQALTEKLGTLTGQMQSEQSLLARLAEQQLEMQPIIARIAERSEREGALDPDSRVHIHNIDLRLAALMEDVHSGRNEMLREVRNEIKLLARTLSMLRNTGDRT